MGYSIEHGDILKWAEQYAGDPFHAAFMDSPYHLTGLHKRFGKPDSAPAQFGSDGAFQRASRGFMGSKWDGGDIAFRPETWAAIARHVHPGGFIASYAGSRGWHRMACAMEDAGLLIHPTIFCWAYGSGFPKATRIDAQIDADAFRGWLAQHPAERDRLRALMRAGKHSKAAKEDARAYQAQLKERAGLAPRVIGEKRHTAKFAAAELGYREKDNGFNSRDRESFELTESATELGRDWAGHRYGGQAIKPAVEPIIIAQRPYEGRPVDCITGSGAGALWVDGARIAMNESWSGGPRSGAEGDSLGATLNTQASDSHPLGRWPANLALSHSPACNGHCVQDCPVRRLGEQSGESQATRSVRVDRNTKPGYEGGWAPLAIERGHDDSGTAARFFYNADWQLERLEATDPVGYYAKASKAEREAGLDDMQVRIMQDLCGDDEDELFEDDTIDDGRPTPIDNPFQRGETTRKNIHPTLKPIALNRWLATLLLPPARYAPRRLLVPFAGAGSEVIGAMLAGWEAVQGVELEEAHVKIAEARLAFWAQMRYRLGALDAPIKIKSAPRAPAGQLELF